MTDHKEKALALASKLGIVADDDELAQFYAEARAEALDEAMRICGRRTRPIRHIWDMQRYVNQGINECYTAIFHAIKESQ